MNKTISIIRLAVLLIICGLSLLLIFGEENDTDINAWMLHFVVDKAIGLAGIGLAVCLYRHWAKTDPGFSAYDEMCDEALEDNDIDRL